MCGPLVTGSTQRYLRFRMRLLSTTVDSLHSLADTMGMASALALLFLPLVKSTPFLYNPAARVASPNTKL